MHNQRIPQSVSRQISVDGRPADGCRHATPKAEISTNKSSARRCIAVPPIFKLLYDYLTVHPRVRRANVVIAAGLVEGDGLGLARAQRPRIPVPNFAVVKGSRGMRRVAGIREGTAVPAFTRARLGK